MPKPVSVIAFMDLLGTTYYAQTDKSRYRQNLGQFEAALRSRAPILKGAGQVFFFSDCAYLTSSNAQKLIEYIQEVRTYLLPYHLYLQGAAQPGTLAPRTTNDNDSVVQGTIFGADVAPVFAQQHALKGAAVRIADVLVRDGFLSPSHCVKSCHLPNPTNSIPECFLDIRYRPKLDIDQEQIQSVLVDCVRAKSVRPSAGAYYVSVLVSMIRSADWTAVNLNVETSRNDTAARHLYDFLIQGEVSRHFGDLRGSEFVFFAMLDEVYRQCENRLVCRHVREYIAHHPRILHRIETAPADLLAHDHRRKFLESTLDWSALSRRLSSRIAKQPEKQSQKESQ